MLYVVHGCDVVAVIMNLNGARQIRPRPRLVAHLDLVGLHLPGIDPREGLVVVAELKITGDAQSVYGSRHDTQEQGILVDGGDVARSIITRFGIGFAVTLHNRAGHRAVVIACNRPAERRRPGRNHRAPQEKGSPRSRRPRPENRTPSLERLVRTRDGTVGVEISDAARCIAC